MKLVVVTLVIVLVMLIQDTEAKKKSKKGNVPVCKKTDITGLKADITELEKSLKFDNSEFGNSLMSNITELKHSLKSDFAELETSLNSDVTEIKSKLSSLEAKLLTKLEELKTKQCCEKAENETIKNDCPPVSPNSGEVIDVQTTHGETFKAVCKQGWLSIARRFDGSVDFYRTWKEYEKGFGNPAGEYFIGLKNLAALLSQGSYPLRVELTTWPPTETRFAQYSTFKVSRFDKYRLTISGYSGTATDSMIIHNGMAFSTRDMDNDIYDGSSSCATKFTGGWWYKKCHHSNLFGTYFSQAKSTYGQGITWYNWKGDYYSFKEIDMKIYTQCKTTQ